MDFDIPHTPRDWYWIVGGDASKAWSSLSSSYVTEYPEDRITRIATAEDLSDVLRQWGLKVPAPAVADIKAEAQRRIIAITGAPDLQSCLIKQLNAQMRATELVNKRALGYALTEAELAEAAALQDLADGIKAIRAASNELEIGPPADYTNDIYW